MKSYKVAVLPGDGIGPEVMAQARRVLEEAARLFGFRLELTEGLIGQTAIEATGKALPPESLTAARQADAVLLGPVDGPRWERVVGLNHPKQAIYKLRGWLGTYATLRPIKTYHALSGLSPLKHELQNFNVMFVYDHASGLPYGTPRSLGYETDELVARNTQVYSASEIARVGRVAFQIASERQKRVLAVDMSQKLETGELWRDVMELVMAEHPDIALERLDADNFMFNMVTHPGRYDVVTAEATTGELLAATAAGLTGAYAVHPAAFVGGATGIFGPVHGAALDIAGTNTANPIAAIRAVAMLLDHGVHQEQDPAAEAIERAVEQVLNDSLMPADVCPSGWTSKKTDEIGDAVIQALRAIAAPTAKPVEFAAAEPTAEERADQAVPAQTGKTPPLPGELRRATDRVAEKEV